MPPKSNGASRGSHIQKNRVADVIGVYKVMTQIIRMMVVYVKSQGLCRRSIVSVSTDTGRGLRLALGKILKQESLPPYACWG